MSLESPSYLHLRLEKNRYYLSFRLDRYLWSSSAMLSFVLQHPRTYV